MRGERDRGKTTATEKRRKRWWRGGRNGGEKREMEDRQERWRRVERAEAD